ncbi:uncharacterized protein LOC141849359 [Brevipalpus obovatus]|uniref:uncharacterized protein LOC141849359 n=1 Tax=Brevipalpus obovatus TaxID=246614 RepID=UPI003D9ED564
MMTDKFSRHLIVFLQFCLVCQKVYCDQVSPLKPINTTQLLEKIMENGLLDAIPGEVVIKLFDPLTDGLVSSSLKKLSEDPNYKVKLIGISGSEALRLADQHTDGLIRKRLQDSSSSLANVFNNLHSRFPDIEKEKTPKRTTRSVPQASEEDTKAGHSITADLSSSTNGLREKKNFDEMDRSGFSGFRGRRNFDEMDRSGFSGFRGRRNFDEMDRSGFSGFRGRRNFDEMDRTGFSGFRGRRNFDEIDRSGFSGFRGRRNFDEIDRSGFSGFRG